MNKKRVDGYIERASRLIKEADIPDSKNVIHRAFRSYISTLGASITMGSLRAAVAFFTAQGGAEEPRNKLVKIVYALISGKEYGEVENDDLIRYIEEVNNDRKVKDEVCDAAIAVKLAMNLYNLRDVGAREQILSVIYSLNNGKPYEETDKGDLMAYVKDGVDDSEVERAICAAASALEYAMDLFDYSREE